MKIEDYIWVTGESSRDITEQIRDLIEKGYELYGPPMMNILVLTSGYINHTDQIRGVGGGRTDSTESIWFC